MSEPTDDRAALAAPVTEAGKRLLEATWTNDWMLAPREENEAMVAAVEAEATARALDLPPDPERLARAMRDGVVPEWDERHDADPLLHDREWAAAIIAAWPTK